MTFVADSAPDNDLACYFRKRREKKIISFSYFIWNTERFVHFREADELWRVF